MTRNSCVKFYASNARTLLGVHRKSHVHEFMYEFIFSMNSYMNSYMKCLPGRFLAHLNSFHEIMPDMLEFGLFFMGEIILS